MRIATLIFLGSLAAAPLQGQAPAPDPAVMANIDEAFRLAGVRNILESLPSHVREMTAAAVSQLPKDKRQQYQPLIKDVSLKFLDPDRFSRQLRTYFAKHYDAGHMNTYLALERTPVYRTMHHLEDGADVLAAQAARRRFEANLKADPPPIARVDILQRLDEARKTTDLQVRIVVGIMNAMTTGLGTQLPSDLEPQSAEFKAKITPLLANDVLLTNLYIYRNSEDADLEDYVGAAQQPDVAWFNRNLQAAILAVAAERSARAGEYIKTKIAQPLN